MVSVLSANTPVTVLEILVFVITSSALQESVLLFTMQPTLHVPAVCAMLTEIAKQAIVWLTMIVFQS